MTEQEGARPPDEPPVWLYAICTYNVERLRELLENRQCDLSSCYGLKRETPLAWALNRLSRRPGKTLVSGRWLHDCDKCGARVTGKDATCPLCSGAWYCSDECAVAHWGAHKMICQDVSVIMLGL